MRAGPTRSGARTLSRPRGLTWAPVLVFHEAMPETKTYTGGCHCGRVRYETTTDLGQLIACNCSICSKKAHVLTFVAAERFRLLSGEGDLTDYQFNKKNVHHLFCRVCGIQSFTHGTSKDGKTMYSINVRCLDGVDLSGLTVTHVDGKSR
jgi:hypothetical protein